VPSVAVDTAHGISVSRLALAEFRCFPRLVLTADDRPVVLVGANGVGKTTILEALSLLTPGAGLRGARLADLGRREAPPGTTWAVNAHIRGAEGAVDIGTGRGDGDEARRVVRIDGRPARGPAALGAVASALWLTPPMERLFGDGAGARRRFVDRLVFGFDAGHAKRVARYERTLRERARLLREGRADAAWLRALEARIAETGIAVAAARRATIRRLAAALADGVGPFPGGVLALIGTVEDWLETMPAVEAEGRFAEALAASRRRDAETGGAAVGPHRGDLDARHGPLALPAAQCSTGEQKALLIAILLAAARAQADQRGIVPLLLLDEVAAHLDESRRLALFDAITALGAQAWITGSEAAVFAPLGDRARILAIAGGRAEPIT